MLHFTKWKAGAILVVVFFGFVMALPNILPQGVRDAIPAFLPSTPVTLGLDLQGGSHVLLEVDGKDLTDQLAKQLIGDIRQTLREKKIRRYSGLGRTDDGGVSVRITEDADVERAYTELKTLSQPVSIGLFGQGGQSSEFDVSRDGNVIHFAFTDAGLDSRIGRAIEQSLEIIGQRINALGTTEPTIQRQGADRIVVQVPGLQDPEQVKRLLGKTAKLQFRLLCEAQPTGDNQRPPPECEAVPEQKIRRASIGCRPRARPPSMAETSRTPSRPSTSAPTSRSFPSASTAKERCALGG